jgi:predicted transcriptional regulator
VFEMSIAPRALNAQAPPDPEAVEPALMTVAEAAARLGRTEKQVRADLEHGTLAGFKPGGLRASRWAVYRWSVDELAGGQRGVDPVALAQKFRRFYRIQLEKIALDVEQGKLAQEIEDDLRASTLCREPVR